MAKYVHEIFSIVVFTIETEGKDEEEAGDLAYKELCKIETKGSFRIDDNFEWNTRKKGE